LVDKIRAFAAIIGVAFLISGLYMTNGTMALLRGSQETTATFVNYNLQGKVYYPIFTFKDDSGSTVTAQSSDGSINKMYQIGYKVPILYDPNNPTANVRVNSFANIWLGPIIFMAMGGFAVALSIALYLRKPRAHASEPASTHGIRTRVRDEQENN